MKSYLLDHAVHIVLSIVLFTAATTVTRAQDAAQTDEDQGRSIGDTAFAIASKRSSPSSAKVAVKRTGSRRVARYRRTSKALRVSPGGTASGKPIVPPSPDPETGLIPVGDAEIGVTVWRLRQAGAKEQGARLLDISAPDGAWLPERVAAESPLAEGERVRLSVETPRDGYLYIFDRERYADGSLSDPYLIFPLSITRQGDNHVRAGAVVEIPAQTDPTPYFTLRSSSASQIGEVLTIIVTLKPLAGVPLEARPVRFDAQQVAAWLTQWSAPFERFEMEGGVGQTYTAAEKAAGADKERLLTIDEPTPQTIYRLAPLAGNPLLINVTLPIRR